MLPESHSRNRTTGESQSLAGPGLVLSGRKHYAFARAGLTFARGRLAERATWRGHAWSPWPNLRRCEAFNLEPPCSPWLGDLPTNAVADDAEESSVSSDEEDDE